MLDLRTGVGQIGSRASGVERTIGRPRPVANCKNRRNRSQADSKLKTAQQTIKSYNGGRLSAPEGGQILRLEPLDTPL